MKLGIKILAIFMAAIAVSVTFFVLFNLPAPSVSIESKNWLQGWNYRKSHPISGSPGAGTDYQIKITTLYGSGMDTSSDVYLGSKSQTNFNDVRFTDDDGLTFLDY